MRIAVLYVAYLASALVIIRAEARWLDRHLDQAGSVARVIVLAVLE